MVDTQDSHDVLAKVAARMRWSCDDPGAIEHWQPGLGLTDSRTLAHLPAEVSHRLSLPYRALLRVMATIRRRDIEAYRFNLFRFPAE